MEQDKESQRMIFTRKAAWLGFIAYLVLMAVVAAIFLLG